VAFGFDPQGRMVWLDVLGPAAPAAGALCRHHAESMVLPRGWWLEDRRDKSALFAVGGDMIAADGQRTARRPARPRRPARRRITPPEASAEAPSWTPAFATVGDMDGLLAPSTPLLSRAFQGVPLAE
jgi:hypothetical protein